MDTPRPPPISRQAFVVDGDTEGPIAAANDGPPHRGRGCRRKGCDAYIRRLEMTNRALMARLKVGPLALSPDTSSPAKLDVQLELIAGEENESGVRKKLREDQVPLTAVGGDSKAPSSSPRSPAAKRRRQQWCKVCGSFPSPVAAVGNTAEGSPACAAHGGRAE